MGVGPVIINAINTLHLIFQAWQRNQLLMNFLKVTVTPLRYALLKASHGQSRIDASSMFRYD